VGAENFCLVHVSLVPMLGSVGEQKTKPTQHTVKELRSVGLNPDIILCRSASPLNSGSREKLALFCQVPPEQVLTVHDVPNIYHVPLLLEAQGATRIISRKLKLNLHSGPALGPWRALAAAVDAAESEVKIALVGKYNFLQDSYLSVIKALQHAAIAAGRRLLVDWVDATALEAASEKSDGEAHRMSWELVRAAHGVLVPGGFGDRGVEGKIAAIRYARERGVPFLGICLGMQCLVIEFARNVLGLAGANSTEFSPEAPHPVIIFMPEINPTQMGGTMRLGSRATYLRPHPEGGKFTLAQDLYGRGSKCSCFFFLSFFFLLLLLLMGSFCTPPPHYYSPTPSHPGFALFFSAAAVNERHRHRYEVNPEIVPRLQAAGLIIAGTDERNSRMEIIELPRGRAEECEGGSGAGGDASPAAAAAAAAAASAAAAPSSPAGAGAAAAGGGGSTPATHPFFLGCQYHPEFQSHPHRPSPPFLGFVLAASGQGALIAARAAACAGGGAEPLGATGGGGGASSASGGSSSSSNSPLNTSTASTATAGGSIPPSPTRPMRTVGVATVPLLGEVKDIAPGESRGGGVPAARRVRTGLGTGSIDEQ
jgi:CTP synthase (UTP-ammonia lyase)